VIAILAGLAILPATLSAQAKTFTKPPSGQGGGLTLSTPRSASGSGTWWGGFGLDPILLGGLLPHHDVREHGPHRTNSAFEMGGLLTIKGHTHPVTFRGQYR
jgi:hypothetical protein